MSVKPLMAWLLTRIRREYDFDAANACRYPPMMPATRASPSPASLRRRASLGVMSFADTAYIDRADFAQRDWWHCSSALRRRAVVSLMWQSKCGRQKLSYRARGPGTPSSRRSQSGPTSRQCGRHTGPMRARRIAKAPVDRPTPIDKDETNSFPASQPEKCPQEAPYAACPVRVAISAIANDAGTHLVGCQNRGRYAPT